MVSSAGGTQGATFVKYGLRAYVGIESILCTRREGTAVVSLKHDLALAANDHDYGLGADTFSLEQAIGRPRLQGNESRQALQCDPGSAVGGFTVARNLWNGRERDIRSLTLRCTDLPPANTP